jgi:protein involved in plasmid replication-relaxation
VRPVCPGFLPVLAPCLLGGRLLRPGRLVQFLRIGLDQRSPGLQWRQWHAFAIAFSSRLPHTVGANGIFTALAAAARTSGGQAALQCWWGERRCAATWGEHARPDGYGRWSEQPPGRPPVAVDFFLEYDTGTEDLPRLIGKLAGYAALAARTGMTTPVLFWLPTARREAALRARLAGPPPHGTPGASAAQVPGVPVATAAPGTGADGPAGAAWLPAGRPGPRLRLAALAPPGTAGPAAAPGETPALPGGLPWHPPAPSPPAWDALAGRPRPARAS